MYLYVRIIEKEDYYKGENAEFNYRVKLKLEEASGERCLIVPFEEFNMDALKDLQPRAVAISGFAKSFQFFDIKSFLGIDEFFHNSNIPTIAFCGGHQLMGFSFNQNLRKTERLYDQGMKKLEPHEDGAVYQFGTERWYNTSDIHQITKVKEDPLFDGLPDSMLLPCYHYCEIKKLPDGFDILASSAHCKIEAVKHKTRPLYGTQFHPESYNDRNQDGRIILENFAKITDNFWQGKQWSHV